MGIYNAEPDVRYAVLQIAPGSRTVVAVGPAPKSRIDTLTRHLKLL